MKTLMMIILLVSSCAAQSTTITLNDNDYFRLQRTNTPTRSYDFKITTGGLFSAPGYYMGPDREVTIDRIAGRERALTIQGAQTNTDNYVTSLWVSCGTQNPSIQMNWIVCDRTQSPLYKSNIAGWSIAHFTENFAQPNSAGHPYWYEGPQADGLSYAWNVDGYGNQYTYRRSSLVTNNWERGGMWWSGSEWYAGTQTGGSGVKLPFVLVGAPVAIEDPLSIEGTVTVQGQRGFTRSCPGGQVPVFKEGIAVGCQ